MPGCCAFGCSNRPEKGYKMFYVPRGRNNEARRKTWIVRINRQNFVPSKRSCLCEAHFEPSQFEPKIPGKLRPNAVPSIFSHHVKSPPKKRRKSNSPTTDDQASTARNRSDHSYGTKSPSLYEDLLLSPGKDSKSLWQPIGTSDLAVVCSKHFTADDFKQGLKVTRLKEGAIPSVFRDYPMHRQKAKPKRKEQKSIGPAQKQSSDTKKLQELDSVPSGNDSDNPWQSFGKSICSRHFRNHALEQELKDKPLISNDVPSMCSNNSPRREETKRQLALIPKNIDATEVLMEEGNKLPSSDEEYPEICSFSSNLKNPADDASDSGRLVKTHIIYVSAASKENDITKASEMKSTCSSDEDDSANKDFSLNRERFSDSISDTESMSATTRQLSSHSENEDSVEFMEKESDAVEVLTKLISTPSSNKESSVNCELNFNPQHSSDNSMKIERTVTTRDASVATQLTIKSISDYRKKYSYLLKKCKRLENSLSFCKKKNKILEVQIAEMEAYWNV